MDHSILRGKPFGTYFRYSIPWTLALIMTSSAGIVDGVFIGRWVGAAGLGGVNIVFPLFTLWIGLGIVFAVGGTIRYAKYMGENNQAKGRAIFTKTILAILGINVIFQGAGLLFPEIVITLLGVSGELWEPALTYFKILVLFGPVLSLDLGLAYFLRADGHPTLSSVGLAVGAVVNVALDALFIAGFGWGVAGAAWATGIAQVASFSILLSYFFTPGCRLRFTSAWGSWKEVVHTFCNGSSELISEASSGLMIVMYNWVMVIRLGTPGVAAFSVVSYTLWFGTLVVYGFSDPMAMLVSANRAAGKFIRANRFLMLAMITVFLNGGILWLILTFLKEPLIHFFLPNEPDIGKVTASFIDVFKYSFLLSGFNITLTAYFSGCHRALDSILVAASRGFLFPLIFILTLPQWLDAFGIFIVTPLTEGVTFGIALFLLLRGPPRHRDKMSGESL